MPTSDTTMPTISFGCGIWLKNSMPEDHPARHFLGGDQADDGRMRPPQRRVVERVAHAQGQQPGQKHRQP